MLATWDCGGMKFDDSLIVDRRQSSQIKSIAQNAEA
jgi:hypothetical protein